jgi:hypothetical protein
MRYVRHSPVVTHVSQLKKPIEGFALLFAQLACLDKALMD